MIILKNETKKIISVLKKDYTHLQIQPLSQVQIDEKLVKFIPSDIKQLSPDEVETKKTKPVKDETESKVEVKETKPVKDETETKPVKDENIQETKKPQPKRRGRKPKKETE